MPPTDLPLPSSVPPPAPPHAPVDRPVPFDITSPVGILDPTGLRANPLTGRPYENKHAADASFGRQTYAELAAGWIILSMYDKRQELLRSMRDHQIVCAMSGTGSGKTVLFPKCALHVGSYKRKVICGIPKKIITQTNAAYAAAALDVTLCRKMGFKYRKSNLKMWSPKSTMLTFATTGTIATMLQNDPMLQDYGYIVIDEAHERSMAMDKLLTLVKELVQWQNDIKVVIMSATINLATYQTSFPTPAFDCTCPWNSSRSSSFGSAADRDR